MSLCRQVSFHCAIPDQHLNFSSQVRFALSSAPTFSRADMETDSQALYNSLYRFLDDPDEKEDVAELVQWYNR